jgi:nicotinate-nucleotide adenylyltransferase
MKVGLFGGSFDPAHDGHEHVARAALRRLGLDRVIWLVSPQNPLKAGKPSATRQARLESARGFARGPSMIVSDAEGRLGAQFTIDTVRRLKARFPRVRFVWIMGADALAGFHRWKQWKAIMDEVPLAIVARPGVGLGGLYAPAAAIFRRHRLPEAAARGLARRDPPAWVYLSAPLNFTSSTALRNRRRPQGATVLP